MINKREKGNAKFFIKTGGGNAIFTFVTAGTILFAMPQYCVWQQNKAGEAEFRAEKESAKSLANAENYLLGDALKESKNEIIYIPTEAGIPITESARFKPKP